MTARRHTSDPSASAGDAMMIDDTSSTQDVNGAIRAGIGVAVLVTTGKYREGDEEKSLDNGVACNDSREVDLL